MSAVALASNSPALSNSLVQPRANSQRPRACSNSLRSCPVHSSLSLSLFPLMLPHGGAGNPSISVLNSLPAFLRQGQTLFHASPAWIVMTLPSLAFNLDGRAGRAAGREPVCCEVRGVQAHSPCTEPRLIRGNRRQRISIFTGIRRRHNRGTKMFRTHTRGRVPRCTMNL